MATEVLAIHTYYESGITVCDYTPEASYQTVATTYNLPALQNVYAFVPGRRDLLKHAMFTILNSEPIKVEDQED